MQPAAQPQQQSQSQQQWQQQYPTQQLQQQHQAQQWEQLPQQWKQLQHQQAQQPLQHKPPHHQSQRIRRTGQCSVCLRVLSLTAAGLIHQHGPSPGCPGTGRQPIVGSTCIKNPELSTAAPPSTSTSSVNNSQQDLLQSLSSQRCRLLKRIPKASRTLAAEKLAAVLSRIIANPDDLSAWSDILRFSFACLAVPGGRGGKNHQSNLTSKVNSALNAYPERPTDRSSQSKPQSIYFDS